MDSFKPAETFKTNLKPLLKSKNQNQFISWIITVLAFSIPLFFLPITSNFYLLNKVTLLYIVMGLFLLIWAAKIFTSQKITLVKTPLNLAIAGLIIIYLLSTFLQTPNQIAALGGQTGIMISLCLLYFVIVNFIKGKKTTAKIIIGLIASSMVLTWLTIFSYLGILEKAGPEWLNKVWSPAGSPLTTVNLTLILLPGILYWGFKSKEPLEKILLFLASGLQILSLILIISLFVDKTLSFNYLYPHYGWAIAVEGFKNIRTAILGVGPGNFLSAFSRFRPVGLNNTGFWAMKFTANSNHYLHLLSTVGVLGLFFYGWIALKTLKRKNFKGSLQTKVIYICLTASFLIQLLIRADFVVLFITFLLLGLFQSLKIPAEQEKYKLSSPAVVWGAFGGAILLALTTFYWQGRVWIADHFFYQSLLAAQDNKGGETYNLQIKAIKLNPYAENYRTSYANTNLALANSLSQQTDLTDQKKSDITQLVSQAIREAKAATSLNPQISSHWVNLANIYRNLINLTSDANQWTSASYLQAIRTDPTNPLLRVDFGSLFYALGDYEQAANQFSQSVNLKPDYANGYYNLASTYKMREDWQRAFSSLQQALNLVPVDSQDYQKVTLELEELKTKLEEMQIKTDVPASIDGESELEAPKLLPSPDPRVGEINLPRESGPEIPEVPEEEEIEENEEATSGADL